jgi:hypothetical protein
VGRERDSRMVFGVESYGAGTSQSQVGCDNRSVLQIMIPSLTRQATVQPHHHVQSVRVKPFKLNGRLNLLPRAFSPWVSRQRLWWCEKAVRHITLPSLITAASFQLPLTHFKAPFETVFEAQRYSSAEKAIPSLSLFPRILVWEVRLTHHHVRTKQASSITN